MATTTKTAPAAKPTSITELRRQRKAGVVATTPAGNVFLIRPPNVERHLLAGGFPPRLREIAMAGAKGIDRGIAAAADGDRELRDYLDSLVRLTVVDPDLNVPADTAADGLVDLDELLHPADYRWLLVVAFGEQDRDGDGKFMWGREPVSRMREFADAHGCEPGCPDCERARDRLSLA